MLSVWIFSIIYFSNTAQAALYEFFPQNADIFERCANKPGNSGIHDVIDMSEFKIEFNEGSVSANGNMTFLWDGVKSRDRIFAIMEMFKFQRGTWQPTIFTVSLHDFCAEQFNENSVWYKVWSAYVPENERKCVNNYGHTYHYRPLEADTVVEFGTNVEGRYKLVIRVNAYDELNRERPNSICFEIPGEFIKV